MIARSKNPSGKPKAATAVRVKTARLRKAPLRHESLEDDCLMLEAPAGSDGAASPPEPDRALQLNSSLMELGDAIEAFSDADWSKLVDDVVSFDADPAGSPAKPATADEVAAALQSEDVHSKEGDLAGSDLLGLDVTVGLGLFNDADEINSDIVLAQAEPDPAQTSSGTHQPGSYRFRCERTDDASDPLPTIADSPIDSFDAQRQGGMPAFAGSEAGFVPLTAGTGFLINTADLIDSTYALVSDAPAALVATAGDGTVSLSWDAVDGAVGYNIFRGAKAGGEVATSINASLVIGTTFTDTGLTNGQTYFYQVTAIDLGVEGDRSNEASATPIATAGVPPGVPPAFDGAAVVETATYAAPILPASLTDGEMDRSIDGEVSAITWGGGSTGGDGEAGSSAPGGQPFKKPENDAAASRLFDPSFLVR